MDHHASHRPRLRAALALLPLLLGGCASDPYAALRSDQVDVLAVVEFGADQNEQVRRMDAPHRRHVIVRIRNRDDYGAELVGIRGVVLLAGGEEGRLEDVRLATSAGERIALDLEPELDGLRFAVRGFPPLGNRDSYLLWLVLGRAPGGRYAVELVAEY